MYSLQDLSSLTGVKPKTLAKWIERGVLPHAVHPSHSRSNRLATYTPAHIRRIREIQHLRESNRTLLDLRDYFNPEQGL
jgi:DNA-binding transcriptional MerR regulator